MYPMELEVKYTTQADLHRALAQEGKRWTTYSDLGVSLHAMRQLGHWLPFTPVERYTFAEQMELVIQYRGIHGVQEHQQSRRVNPVAKPGDPSPWMW